ncbi:MAG: LysR family transcriptional regulator [Clostridiaceae bacterium]
MDINFELYKVFYTVARTGSFSQAAKGLFISQSAVSQSIRGLEENAGCPLFIRGARNVRLTSAGEMLFSHVEQAYNLLKSAENKLLEMQSLRFGEIKIGVGDTILKYLLTPYLQQFIRDYPKIKIQIINRTSPGIIDSIKRGAVDFGLVTLPVNDRDIETTLFREVEDVFVASQRFNQLSGREVGISELSTVPLLLLQKESATRRNLDEYFTLKGLVITPEIELESMDLLVEYSRIGLGVAHVLKESADALISAGELFALKLAEPIPKRKLGVAKQKNVPLSQAASQFASILTATKNSWSSIQK